MKRRSKYHACITSEETGRVFCSVIIRSPVRSITAKGRNADARPSRYRNGSRLLLSRKALTRAYERSIVGKKGEGGRYGGVTLRADFRYTERLGCLQPL